MKEIEIVIVVALEEGTPVGASLLKKHLKLIDIGAHSRYNNKRNWIRH